MESTRLSGIERELVLQYLIDGNVPVTVTPVDDESDSDADAIKPATSAVFPVAIKAEGVKVLDAGIILLTNPPESVKNFKTNKVRVEFYFNRLGLYFVTEIKESSAGLALVIPATICRISEIVEQRKTDFFASLYYSVNEKTDVHIDCIPAENYTLFSKPVWKDIQEECQVRAKEYLEEFIAHARANGVAGNGVQLIPVVRYLAEQKEHIQSVQGRQEPLDIVFVNHERIVFASKKNNMDLKNGTEYALEMKFPLPKPLSERNIFVTCCVEDNYSDDSDTFNCAVCRYTSIKQEDLRFLYEKCTNEIFV